MKKFVPSFRFILLLVALSLSPAPGRAADPVAPPATSPPVAPPAAQRHSFHGQITALDATALTLTVEGLALKATAATRVTKAGKPAAFSDLGVGDTVDGTYKSDEAGGLSVVNIRIAVIAPDMPRKKKAAPAAPSEPAPQN